MRHRVYGRHLGRDKNQRQALFKSLVQSLFIHGTIETSQTKVKAIKGLVDRLINLAKNKNTQHMIQSFFTTKALQDRIVKEVAPKLSDRQSGYTTAVKMGSREGDRTMMVRMSLINNEQLKPLEKKALASKPHSADKKIEDKAVKVTATSEVKKSTPESRIGKVSVTAKKATVGKAITK